MIRDGMAHRRPQRGEEGFALLFVFALAATIAIALYAEMPRVVFEQQREREQLLIDRGEQYRRAIQLYVRKANRYPQRLEDLEDFQGQRFLRRAYKDPMTGQDWRLIRINEAGVLENSLIHKRRSPSGGEGSEAGLESSFAGNRGEFGGGVVQNNPAPSAAALQGASDRAPAPSQAPFPGGVAPGMEPTTGQPASVAAYDPSSAQMVPTPSVPAGDLPGAGEPAQPDQPTAVGTPGFPQPQPGYPNQAQSGMAGQPSLAVAGGSIATGMQPAAGPFGQPVGSPAGVWRPVTPTPSASPSAAAPGMAPGVGPPPQQAADLIRQILTRPRPGGPPAQAGSAGRQSMGAGIAGVASTLEMEGIKIYNEQREYHKWEFIYDYTQDRSRLPRAAEQPAEASKSPSTTVPLGGSLGSGFGGGSSGIPPRRGSGSVR